MNESLKAKTASNIIYNLLCRLVVFLLSFTTGIILARNLTSSDYGIVGFAMICIGFLQQFNNLGIGSAVVQKETIGERELYTAFTLKIILGLFAFALSFIWGSVSQKALANPAVKAVVVVLSTDFLISILGFLPSAILTRELKFKRLIIPQVGAQAIATAVAIATVYQGYRYWSIVFSNLASSLAWAVIVFILRPVSLKIKWDLKAAKELLKFGSHLFFAGLMAFLLGNADNFVIGAEMGAAMLGFYAIAFDWSTKMPRFLGSVVQNVVFSTFARVQRDTDRLRRGYLAILEYASLGGILVNVLLLLLSQDVLILVLGGGTKKWLPALSTLRILCAYGALRVVIEPVLSTVTAIGKPSLIFKANALAAALQVACLYPAVRYFGIEGVALTVTFSYAVQFLIYFPALRREMDLPYSLVFRSVYPAVVSGCVLAAFGFTLDRFMNTSWLSLAIKLSIGCSIYLGTYGCATRWKMLQDAKEIIGTVLLKPN